MLSPAAAKIAPYALKWAKIWNIPVSYVLAICEIESSFRVDVKNLTAISQGGAWGLMQVTATTAATLVEQIRATIPRNVASMAPIGRTALQQSFADMLIYKWRQGDPPCLLDPDLNVMLGTFYLARFVREFGRRFAEVAVAYHNGAGFLRTFLHTYPIGTAGRHRFPEDLPPKAKEYAARAVAAQAKYVGEDQEPPRVA